MTSKKKNLFGNTWDLGTFLNERTAKIVSVSLYKNMKMIAMKALFIFKIIIMFNVATIFCSKYISLLQEMNMESALILADHDVLKSREFVKIMRTLMKKNELVFLLLK